MNVAQALVVITAMETPMSTDVSREIQTLPVTNYSPAISRAIEWLGDRYLLANPANVVPRRKLTARVGFSPQMRQPDTSFQRRDQYG